MFVPCPSPSPTAPPPPPPSPSPPPAPTCDAPPVPPLDLLVPFKAPPCDPGFRPIDVEGAGRLCVAKSACGNARGCEPGEFGLEASCHVCEPSGIRYKWEPETRLLYNAKRGEWMDAYCRRSVDGIAPADGPHGMPEYFGICTWATPCPPQPSPSPTVAPSPDPACAAPRLVRTKGGSSGYGPPQLVSPGRVRVAVTFTMLFGKEGLEGGPCEPQRPWWASVCCARELDDPLGLDIRYTTHGDAEVTFDPRNPYNATVEGSPGSSVDWRVCPREPRMRRRAPCERNFDECDNSEANAERAGTHEQGACTSATLTLPKVKESP